MCTINDCVYSAGWVNWTRAWKVGHYKKLSWPFPAYTSWIFLIFLLYILDISWSHLKLMKFEKIFPVVLSLLLSLRRIGCKWIYAIRLRVPQSFFLKLGSYSGVFDPFPIFHVRKKVQVVIWACAAPLHWLAHPKVGVLHCPTIPRAESESAGRVALTQDGRSVPLETRETGTARLI